MEYLVYEFNGVLLATLIPMDDKKMRFSGIVKEANNEKQALKIWINRKNKFSYIA